MSRLKVFISESYNPHLNIATEDWIFNSLNPSQHILYLWQNAETVVIGRNQNPWSECNLAQMKADTVHLARRSTGGGAVFHDLGNTNFTFMSPKESYKKENNIEIILNALKNFGIQGEASGRNDLTVTFPDGPRKFSGSAYREKRDRAFHHGTLLMHTDLTRLGSYLTPHPKKLQAKGKESVRARVMNLKEIAPEIRHDVVVPAIVKSFEDFYQAKAEINYLSLEAVQGIPELKAEYEKLASWDWLYGNTLEFSHQMVEYVSLGFFDFHFKVEEAVIKDLRIFTDCLFPQLVEDLRLSLLEKPYKGSSLRESFTKIKTDHASLVDGLEELEAWLLREVEV